MQTITVCRVNGVTVNAQRFRQRIKGANIKRRIEADSSTPGRTQDEEFTVPLVETLRSQGSRPKLVTAVIRHTHPIVSTGYALSNGRVATIETTEEANDFTRLWVGHSDYVLLWFISRFPGKGYPTHRFLVAQSLTADPLDETQTVVRAVGYDLGCVRNHFPHNIWDQNFRRPDPISHGRIRGSGMETDPLYSEFSNIGSYIGIEIPIVGSLQKVKVLQDGRLQLMAFQSSQIEDPDSRAAVLDAVLQVVDTLRPCEVQ